MLVHSSKYKKEDQEGRISKRRCIARRYIHEGKGQEGYQGSRSKQEELDKKEAGWRSRKEKQPVGKGVEEGVITEGNEKEMKKSNRKSRREWLKGSIRVAVKAD